MTRSEFLANMSIQSYYRYIGAVKMLLKDEGIITPVLILSDEDNGQNIWVFTSKCCRVLQVSHREEDDSDQDSKHFVRITA